MLVYSVFAISVCAIALAVALRRVATLKPFQARLLDTLRSIAVPFAVMGGGFSVLQLVLSYTADRALASHRLDALERAIAMIQTFLSYVELPGWAEFLILALFVVTAWHSVAITTQGRKVSKLYARLSKMLLKAKVYVTLAAALTFFGYGVENGLAQAEATLKSEQAKLLGAYQALAEQSEDAVTQAAATAWQNSTNITNLVRPTSHFMGALKQARLDFPQERFDAWRAIQPSSQDLLDARDRIAKQSVENSIASPATGLRADWIDVEGKSADRSAPPEELISEELSDFIARRREAPPDELGAAVEKAIGLAYGRTFGQVSDLLSSWTGVPKELIELVVDPLVNDPLKDFLAEQANKVFDAALRGRAALHDQLSAMRKAVTMHMDAVYRTANISGRFDMAQDVLMAKLKTEQRKLDEETARILQLSDPARFAAELHTLALEAKVSWAGGPIFINNPDLDRSATDMLSRLASQEWPGLDLVAATAIARSLRSIAKDARADESAPPDLSPDKNGAADANLVDRFYSASKKLDPARQVAIAIDSFRTNIIVWSCRKIATNLSFPYMPALAENPKIDWKHEVIRLAKEDLIAGRQPRSQDWITRFVAWLGENDDELHGYANWEPKDIMKLVAGMGPDELSNRAGGPNYRLEKLTLFAALKQLGQYGQLEAAPAATVLAASKAVSGAYKAADNRREFGEDLKPVKPLPDKPWEPNKPWEPIKPRPRPVLRP
jgi:hypothetical protein